MQARVLLFAKINHENKLKFGPFSPQTSNVPTLLQERKPATRRGALLEFGVDWWERRHPYLD